MRDGSAEIWKIHIKIMPGVSAEFCSYPNLRHKPSTRNLQFHEKKAVLKKENYACRNAYNSGNYIEWKTQKSPRKQGKAGSDARGHRYWKFPSLTVLHRLGGKTFVVRKIFREKSLDRFPVFCLAFPYNKDFPAILFEFFSVFPVTLNVIPELSAPVLGVSFRSRRSRAALVPVPETSMDKENRFPAWEKHVRRTRQILSVKAEPQPETVGN